MARRPVPALREHREKDVVAWLLDYDPALRRQVLRDLADAPAGEVARERYRVAHDGWGAQLLAAQDPDGRWSGGTFFPQRVSTEATLRLLRTLGADPDDSTCSPKRGPDGRWCLEQQHHDRLSIDLGETVGAPSRRAHAPRAARPALGAWSSGVGPAPGVAVVGGGRALRHPHRVGGAWSALDGAEVGVARHVAPRRQVDGRDGIGGDEVDDGSRP
ncbi:hypothetical protein [Cellulomonas flavigena]|uniref:hypothetical protein n=1 Tax=Cellulomonas flavigena TaxID=1711 RepID=UPI0002F92BCE|nr:hypothetical protein [Cellulomonas flavigena]